MCHRPHRKATISKPLSIGVYIWSASRSWEALCLASEISCSQLLSVMAEIIFILERAKTTMEWTVIYFGSFLLVTRGTETSVSVIYSGIWTDVNLVKLVTLGLESVITNHSFRSLWLRNGANYRHFEVLVCGLFFVCFICDLFTPQRPWCPFPWVQV
jgi:hypothetical protein